jgi:hypothetical protein
VSTPRIEREWWLLVRAEDRVRAVHLAEVLGSGSVRLPLPAGATLEDGAPALATVRALRQALVPARPARGEGFAAAFVPRAGAGEAPALVGERESRRRWWAGAERWVLGPTALTLPFDAARELVLPVSAPQAEVVVAGSGALVRWPHRAEEAGIPPRHPGLAGWLPADGPLSVHRVSAREGTDGLRLVTGEELAVRLLGGRA